MKYYITFILLCSGIMQMHAQKLGPSVLAAGGGTATAATIHMDWTLGEMAVDNYTGHPFSVTEGFHQPVVRIDKAYQVPDQSIAGRSPISTDVTVYPNPASDQLVIQIPPASAGEWTIDVWNSHGHLLFAGKVAEDVSTFELDIHEFNKGLFFVHIALPSRDIRTVFKVTKI